MAPVTSPGWKPSPLFPAASLSRSSITPNKPCCTCGYNLLTFLTLTLLSPASGLGLFLSLSPRPPPSLPLSLQAYLGTNTNTSTFSLITDAVIQSWASLWLHSDFVYKGRGNPACIGLTPSPFSWFPGVFDTDLSLHRKCSNTWWQRDCHLMCHLFQRYVHFQRELQRPYLAQGIKLSK